ncbi:2'-5' RNA ligase [Salinibacillus kushneri]|uniref:RNA 2',3'-cyclic phosphodiesterase n=1 Tax=Salinibacillus kushneri TaxID=237682 RepID=A0A1I0JDR3_9BACI|nr:RNA 2',3'-cyclic phosphodiesterase [Salinibacillus kushneri]SEU07981.1 2'-5' RNA ligase [Salinibacillus kushneri]
MGQNPHYFIGIPIAEELQGWLRNWQTEIEKHASYKQWTNEEDFHITLKFLGGMNATQIERIVELMDKLEPPERFYTEIGDLGFFGKKTQPRVVWADVEHIPSLLTLQNRIEEKVIQLGMEEDNRMYRPHVTLAKKWKDPESSLKSREELLAQLPGPMKQRMLVQQFHIYQIEPQEDVKYKPIFTKNLKE